MKKDKAAISNLRNNEAARTDRLQYELIRAANEINRIIITSLIGKI